MRRIIDWIYKHQTKLLIAATVALVALVFALMLAGIAGAQAGGGEKVGENIGRLLGSWAKSLYVGIAAVVALMFLLNRRYADMAVFLLAAVIVGGFVLVPNDVAGIVRDIWTTVVG